MFQMITAPENAPFAVALMVMLGIAVIEGVGAIFGAGLSSLLDTLVGDVDLDADVDGDVDGGSGQIPGSGLLTHTLGWLRVGQVPILVLLIIFLTSFGLIGLGVQSVVFGAIGRYLPAAVAWAPAFAGALPSVRFFGGLIARILPKEETSAVSRDSFIGRIATITVGTATRGAPAEARLTDEFGRSHYVMIEPDLDTDRFSTGDRVLLVRVDGARFRAISPPTESLLDEQSDR
ncbi:MAG TPA: YqiJ family protein [Myxococcota bacterium]|nr:YqiJ family protein [Myxococcales bacterium]HPG27289.1 YqiJ family protein [Myxococcota bacterium]